MKKLQNLVTVFLLVFGTSAYADASQTLIIHQNKETIWDAGHDVILKNVQNNGTCKIEMNNAHSIVIINKDTKDCNVSIIFSENNKNNTKNLFIKTQP